MTSTLPVSRLIPSISSQTCRSAATRSRRSLQPLRRTYSHFFACDRQGIKERQSIRISHLHRSLASRTGLYEVRRQFSVSSVSRHGHLDPPKPGEERKITIIDKDGESHTFEVSDGDNILDIAQANDLEMEGACGGSCACSTCHVIVDSDAMYDAMPEPEDDENDMLDLAFGLTETSRLGCQVQMSKELDGLVVRLPSMTRNMQASDFVDKPKS